VALPHFVRVYTEGLLILHVGTRWRWVVNLTPRPLYPRKRTPETTE